MQHPVIEFLLVRFLSKGAARIISDTEGRHPKASGSQALCFSHSSAFLPESALSPGFCEQQWGLLLLPLQPGRQRAVPILLRLPQNSPQTEVNGVALLSWTSGKGSHSHMVPTLWGGAGVDVGGDVPTMWNLSP